MSARARTKKYTFVSTSPITLSAILGAVGTMDMYVSTVIMRAARLNTGTVEWQHTGDTAGGYLDGKEAVTWDLGPKFLALDQITVTGAVDDVLYITVLA